MCSPQIVLLLLLFAHSAAPTFPLLLVPLLISAPQPSLAHFSPSPLPSSPPSLSKRAFDRLDLSSFDFNKRFDELTPSAESISSISFSYSRPGKSGRRLTEGMMRRRLAQLRAVGGQPSKKKVTRIHGFGLGGLGTPMRFKRRHAWLWLG